MIILENKKDEILLKEIEINPEFQNKGIGTYIIQNIINDAKKQTKPVILYVLKVNPAQKLYKELGFNIFKETDTHFIMKTEI